jgi:hypothetical protein
MPPRASLASARGGRLCEALAANINPPSNHSDKRNQSNHMHDLAFIWGFEIAIDQLYDIHNPPATHNQKHQQYNQIHNFHVILLCHR